MPDQPTTANRDRLGMLIHRALRSHLLAADVALDLPRRERITQDLVDAFAPELAAAWGEGYAEARKEVTTEADQAYWRGHELGRRQATEGQRREWGLQWVPVSGHPSDHPDHIAVFHEESEAREAEPEWRAHRLVSRLVGPWEPEHAFDESSVVNPATGEPYRGSSGPEPYEPPDPLCVCGAPWLGDEGCLTRQPGWTPPPPYDGPSIEELLPGGEPDEQPEPARRDRYMMATSALHKLGDISRDEPDLAIIYGDSGDDWVGQWATGIGYINVRFPKATTRELTDGERATYSKLVIDEAGSVRPIVFDLPASGGVVEPSGPLTAEEATPDCAGCAAEANGEDRLSYTHRRACSSYDAFYDASDSELAVMVSSVRRLHDPGALIEEPDLYEQGEGDESRG